MTALTQLLGAVRGATAQAPCIPACWPAPVPPNLPMPSRACAPLERVAPTLSRSGHTHRSAAAWQAQAAQCHQVRGGRRYTQCSSTPRLQGPCEHDTAKATVPGCCLLHVYVRSGYVQQVVEAVEPGPLDGRLSRWDSSKREQADKEVEEAIANWRAAQVGQDAADAGKRG